MKCYKGSAEVFMLMSRIGQTTRTIQALKGKPFPQIGLPCFCEDSHVEDEGSKMGEQWVSLVLLPAALEVLQVLRNLILGHF